MTNSMLHLWRNIFFDECSNGVEILDASSILITHKGNISAERKRSSCWKTKWSWRFWMVDNFVLWVPNFVSFKWIFSWMLWLNSYVTSKELMNIVMMCQCQNCVIWLTQISSHYFPDMLLIIDTSSSKLIWMSLYKNIYYWLSFSLNKHFEDHFRKKDNFSLHGWVFFKHQGIL